MPRRTARDREPPRPTQAAPTVERLAGDRGHRGSPTRPRGRSRPAGDRVVCSLPRALSLLPPRLASTLRRSIARSHDPRSWPARSPESAGCGGARVAPAPRRHDARPRFAARAGHRDRRDRSRRATLLPSGRRPDHQGCGDRPGDHRSGHPRGRCRTGHRTGRPIGSCRTNRSDSYPPDAPDVRVRLGDCRMRHRPNAGVEVGRRTWRPMLRRGSPRSARGVAVAGDTSTGHRRDENDDERHPMGGARHQSKSGGVLLSQGISPQVPSALRGLTSVFGMGTGVTLSPWPPETCCQLGVHPRTPEQARAIRKESKPSAD